MEYIGKQPLTPGERLIQRSRELGGLALNVMRIPLQVAEMSLRILSGGSESEFATVDDTEGLAPVTPINSMAARSEHGSVSSSEQLPRLGHFKGLTQPNDNLNRQYDL